MSQNYPWPGLSTWSPSPRPLEVDQRFWEVNKQGEEEVGYLEAKLKHKVKKKNPNNVQIICQNIWNSGWVSLTSETPVPEAYKYF